MLGALAVVTVLYLGFNWIDNMQKENKTLAANNATLTVSNEINQKTIELDREYQIKKEELINELGAENAEAYRIEQEERAIFNDSDFAKAFDKKPETVIKLMNRKTIFVFRRFEKLSKEVSELNNNKKAEKTDEKNN